MKRPLPRLAGLLTGALLSLSLFGPVGARAADVVPGEVVVTPEATGAPAAGAAVAGTPSVPGSREITVRTRSGESVAAAVKRLRRTPGVKDAVPNYIARTAADTTPYMPNDPGRHTVVGGWARVQWNFVGPWGVGAPQAWTNLRTAQRSGGRGVIVAVLDTGVAYSNRFSYARSPDLRASTFVRGHDFVSNTDFPRDRNGHGTHVASTIAQWTDNGVGLTGLAYGAKILPVRVLDDAGEGDANTIARGVRYAVQRGAKVINMSLEFAPDDSGMPLKKADIPQLISAIDYAHRKGVLVIAASGNEGATTIDYPAKAPNVVAVGATTEHGCLSAFSNIGKGLDIVAPGGGSDSRHGNDSNCRPGRGKPGRDISQVTLVAQGAKTFGIPGGYEGTSMAVPHVSAAAALVIASGVLGGDPTPREVEVRLKNTARDLGDAGYDRTYGTGLLDAGAATDPAVASTRRGRPVRRYVVRMISTEQGAWWLILLGTEPSRKRLAPVMPLLPTTMRSAPVSSATSRIASAGSP